MLSKTLLERLQQKMMTTAAKAASFTLERRHCETAPRNSEEL
jgi:hypothetical protein